MSDTAFADNVDATIDEGRELTWEELYKIIEKLPEGYGKVFRLAVLDGLSHKEIAALLGIAPHSSSSRFRTQKQCLRRMITQYRMEMGNTLNYWNYNAYLALAINRREETPSTPIISSNTDKEIPFVTDSIEGANSATDSIVPRIKRVHKTIQHPETQRNIAEITITADSIPSIKNDSIANDTVRAFPNIINLKEPIAQEDFPSTQHAEISNWSLSLAYSGTLGENDYNKYRIPNHRESRMWKAMLEKSTLQRKHVIICRWLSDCHSINRFHHVGA